MREPIRTAARVIDKTAGIRYNYLNRDQKAEMEVLDMGTEKERKDTQQAMLYELRRLFKNSGKETYTVEELCDLLDTIADAKAQE